MKDGKKRSAEASKGQVVENGKYVKLAPPTVQPASDDGLTGPLSTEIPAREVKDYVRILLSVDILQDLPYSRLIWLMDYAERRIFAPGTSIINYGEVSDGLYILLDGNARATVRAEQGGSTAVVGVLNPGSYFGAISLIDGLPHSASVEAIDACTCLWVPRTVFGQLMTELALCTAVLKKLCMIVRGSNEWIRRLL